MQVHAKLERTKETDLRGDTIPEEYEEPAGAGEDLR